MIWIVFVLLALGAAVAISAGLLRSAPAGEGEARDVDVYRDQLREIDRDEARGVIGAAEAQAARLEVSRRLLAADRAARETAAGGGAVPVRPLMIVLTGAILLGSLAIYSVIGRPGVGDRPFLARAPEVAAPARIEDLDDRSLAQMLREAVEAHPDEPEGWLLLGRIELRNGNWSEAARAFGEAMALGASSPEVEAAFGEALVLAAGGRVTARAESALQSAMAAGTDDPRPAFYLALRKAQDGDIDGALEDWLALETQAPDDARWLPIVKEKSRGALAVLDGRGDRAALTAATRPLRVAPPAAEMAPPPPSAALGASGMPDPREMVASLAARLEAEPRNAEGWQMLVRSQVVLGEIGAARASLAKASTIFADDAAVLADLTELAGNLGLTGEAPR